MEINEIIKNNVEISDINLLTSKGLYDNNDFTEKFYRLYINYHILLDKYLVRKFSLDKYDKAFDDVKLRFIPVNEEDMDYYQYISQMDLLYIYLRNNIYVEKLSNEEIDKVLNIHDNFLEYPNEEMFELIEKTYRDVIDINNNLDEKIISRYGPDNDNYWFPSNELVIGLRYNIFADNGLGEDEKWVENNTKQVIFMNNLLDNINNDIAKVTDEKVNFVWYNDYTIKEPVLESGK